MSLQAGRERRGAYRSPRPGLADALAAASCSSHHCVVPNPAPLASQALGAKRDYEAAAAAAAARSSSSESAAGAGRANAGDEGGDSILECNGLPMPACGGGGGAAQPCVSCAHSLEWRDTPLQARLVESLGLSAAAAKELAAAKGAW